MLFPIDIILNDNPVAIRDRLPDLNVYVASIIDKCVSREQQMRCEDGKRLLKSIKSQTTNYYDSLAS